MGGRSTIWPMTMITTTLVSRDKNTNQCNWLKKKCKKSNPTLKKIKKTKISQLKPTDAEIKPCSLILTNKKRSLSSRRKFYNNITLRSTMMRTRILRLNRVMEGSISKVSPIPLAPWIPFSNDCLFYMSLFFIVLKIRKCYAAKKYNLTVM